jgi:hypothetical protein
MPKLSININNRRILLKHIYEFKLNNILYKKENYNNINLIEYYRLLLRNNNISYAYYKISGYDDKIKAYLKNLIYHNTKSYAVLKENNKLDYYINGKRLTYNEWRNHKEVRIEKLKNIINI